MLHAELTEKIISSFFKVYNTLGYGFLEKVYENALVTELKRAGFNVLQQQKATDKEVGLLLNFGRTPEFKRVIFTNDRKE